LNFVDGLWVEKYRPKELKDLILSDEYRNKFEEYIEKKEVPHLLFVGPPGSGKSTLAQILTSKKGIINFPKMNCLTINGSSKKCRSISYTDEVIEPFMKHPQIGDDKLKIVYIDEADKLTNDSYDALRGIMEKYVKHSRFIWTGNYISKIPDAIQSRFQIFKFEQVSMEYVFKFCQGILESENIKYKNDDLSYIIKELYPDIRKIINSLERCCSNGQLIFNVDVLKTKEKELINIFIDIINSIREKKNNRVSKLISNTLDLLNEIDLDYCEVYRKLFYTKSIPVPAKIKINQYTNSHKDCLVPSMHFMSMVFEVIKCLGK